MFHCNEWQLGHFNTKGQNGKALLGLSENVQNVRDLDVCQVFVVEWVNLIPFFFRRSLNPGRPRKACVKCIKNVLLPQAV